MALPLPAGEFLVLQRVGVGDLTVLHPDSDSSPVAGPFSSSALHSGLEGF